MNETIALGIFGLFGCSVVCLTEIFKTKYEGAEVGRIIAKAFVAIIMNGIFYVGLANGFWFRIGQYIFIRI